MKVNNKFISNVYDKLDLPIRFLYCRVPFLSKILFWKLYSSDFEKLDSKFEEMKNVVTKNNFNFKNKVCLELGPGNSYINAYNLLMNGAKQVILIDKYSRYLKTKKQKEFFNHELDFIKQKYGQNNLFFIKKGKINHKSIKFIEGDLTEAQIENKVDFILSISVFEHIKNVETVIKKLAGLIKKKGLMYHAIDMRDHYNFNSPFLFYKYSDQTWEKYLTKEGVSFTNRVRYDEYISLFKKYGLEVIFEKVEKFPLPKKIADNFFNSKEIKNIGVANLLIGKND